MGSSLLASFPYSGIQGPRPWFPGRTILPVGLEVGKGGEMVPSPPWVAVGHSGQGLTWESGAGVSPSSHHHLPAVCSQASPVPPLLKQR